MKALTLHQPWASLVALNIKTIETRSWPCPPSLIGQPLAIHAGAKWGMERNAKGHEWHGWSDSLCGLCFAEDVLNVDAVDVPLGAVVATCRVAACVPIVEVGAHPHRASHVGRPRHDPDRLGLWHPTQEPHNPGGIGSGIAYHDAWDHADVTDQLPYGDFSPGRYAWLLEDVEPTTERCPACWGSGAAPDTTDAEVIHAVFTVSPFDGRLPLRRCPACSGVGHCLPVPARGRQRVWNWEATHG